MKRDVNAATRWVDKGIELATLERFEEALECFQQALREDPEYDRAWLHKGEVLATTFRFEEAAECYRKATELNHECAAAWYGWGLALVAVGHFEQAINCFDEAIRIDPHFEGAKEDREQALRDLAQFSRKPSVPENRAKRRWQGIADSFRETDGQTDVSPGMSSPEKPESAVQDDDRGTKAQRTDDLKKDGRSRMMVHECMVCNLPLRFGDNLLWCPYCGTLAHGTHLLEWLHVKKSCPSCHHQLDEEDFTNSAQK